MSTWVETSKIIGTMAGTLYICVKLWIEVRDKTSITSKVAMLSSVLRRSALSFSICGIGGVGLVWAATWELTPASVFVSVLCGVLIALGFSSALLVEMVTRVSTRQ